METDGTEPFPPYAFVPGGPWPHPVSAPGGHSFGARPERAEPIAGDAWRQSRPFRRGVALFNHGYYWEAHEAWEALWHAHGRKGATADVLKGLIKLAASGVKARERQPHGVATHARRAAELFRAARGEGEPAHRLGLDLVALEERARSIAAEPPGDPGPEGARVSVVFGFRIEPR